ncbi:coagulation factor 8 [Artemisia annua]|uniref:Coagulation factor 8 n=1 Tax=Artemisia annua TaxID=35608 RepID=A0A2U1QNS4_ARTAN|nr:coagulation factor 8 [Artemisia annua]
MDSSVWSIVAFIVVLLARASAEIIDLQWVVAGDYTLQPSTFNQTIITVNDDSAYTGDHTMMFIVRLLVLVTFDRLLSDELKCHNTASCADVRPHAWTHLLSLPDATAYGILMLRRPNDPWSLDVVLLDPPGLNICHNSKPTIKRNSMTSLPGCLGEGLRYPDKLNFGGRRATWESISRFFPHNLGMNRFVLTTIGFKGVRTIPRFSTRDGLKQESVATPKLLNTSDDSPLVAKGVLHYANSGSPVTGPIPAGHDPWDIEFSVNQGRSIRWNLTVGAARPNPQGTFNVSNVTLSETIVLHASETNIRGSYRYVVNNVHSDMMLMDSWHLDGYGFYVVGFGDGEWTSRSRSSYNLYDPVVRSTVQVYPRGWTAVYAFLDNPGMWNLRSQHLKHWYLGQELYVRVHDDDPNPAKENPPPENLLLCAYFPPSVTQPASTVIEVGEVTGFTGNPYPSSQELF